MKQFETEDAATALAPLGVEALANADVHDPSSLLGPSRARVGERDGLVVRVFQPDAVAATCVIKETRAPMRQLGAGAFGAWIPGAEPETAYRIEYRYADGHRVVVDDPYRFPTTVGEIDRHLFAEGTHRRAYRFLGAHVKTFLGVPGTRFCVWAPNARRVSVVGDFCGWDGRVYPMRPIPFSGLFELFIPGVREGALYKFELKTREGMLRLKTDPYASSMEMPPASASRVVSSTHQWSDAAWLKQRATRDHAKSPMLIYEVHLGSWARGPSSGESPGGAFLTYRELGKRLVDHVKRLGYTHIELMPISEHAFYGSWGYQVTGYFAPTARYGSPDDLRCFVDACHQAGIGVLLDWVPAHFPRDDFALRRFDGTALYEHEDPRLGEHQDWQTLIFNFGRNEVKTFLVSNAVYWLDEFHIDGLRIDAVASMLYRDYSRQPGQWIPNVFGGRENLEAIELLRAMNHAVREEVPGTITVAEESTAFPDVTKPVSEGGLGFDFKWNMGWMHDTLGYFQLDPIYRTHHHHKMTFAMMYEYSERFINPLSHDEVVHGKGSLLNKMPGYELDRLAQLRCLLAYQYTRPGKVLSFMGTELAPHREWAHDEGLDWGLSQGEWRAAFMRYVEALGALYGSHPALWQKDHEHDGFAWIEVHDASASVYAYMRRATESSYVVVVLNLTPVERAGYRIGVPSPGRYDVLLSSDDTRFGGHDRLRGPLETEDEPSHGHDCSLCLLLPPLSAVILAPAVS